MLSCHMTAVLRQRSADSYVDQNDDVRRMTEAFVEAAYEPDMRIVRSSRRQVRQAADRLLALDGGFLTYVDSDIASRAMGICAEEVAHRLVEKVAQRLQQESTVGMVDALEGNDQSIAMGAVELELQGANVIMRRGTQASELDGAMLIGDHPERILLYDATTSPSYLMEKLQGGEHFFQRMRQYFRRQYGITLEKWHLLFDDRWTEYIDPARAPLGLTDIPKTATAEEGVHVLSVGLRRQVRALQQRVLSHLRDSHYLEWRHGEYRFT